MNELQTKQLALLEDTYRFYMKDPNKRRAMSDGCNCYYRLEENDTLKRCAIGRQLTLKQYQESFENQTVDDIFDRLPTKLKKIGLSLLRDIQKWHDNIDYWDAACNTISPDGQLEYDKIKQAILDGNYHE